MIERTLTTDYGVIMSAAVMDLSHDGIPEVVFTDNSSGDIHAVNGATGELLWDAGVYVSQDSEIALGDIDNDGNIEVIAIVGSIYSGPAQVLVLDLDANGEVIGSTISSEYLSTFTTYAVAPGSQTWMATPLLKS